MDPNVASAKLECGSRDLETTYSLQIPVRDIERMKVFQPLGDIKQLSCESELKLVVPLEFQRW